MLTQTIGMRNREKMPVFLSFLIHARHLIGNKLKDWNILFYLTSIENNMYALSMV